MSGAVVFGFLMLCVYLYCLFGGADFGLGVLEAFSRRDRRTQELSSKVLGPVWEANHMWLIIAIVILFYGYPGVYTRLCVYFHVPLTVMLVGIVLRGCSFIFRAYDDADDPMRRWYSAAFSFSSALTPFTFGMIMAAMFSGKLDPSAQGYRAVYVEPWLEPFAVSAGIFTACVFTFIASVFMVGEVSAGEERRAFVRRALTTGGVTVLAGAGVFAAAAVSKVPLAETYLRHPVSVGCVAAATASLFYLWHALRRGWVWRSRLAMGFQLSMILLAWYAVFFPAALVYADGRRLTFYEAAVSGAPMDVLALGLTGGAFIFLPALFYLFRTFKSENSSRSY